MKVASLTRLFQNENRVLHGLLAQVEAERSRSQSMRPGVIRQLLMEIETACVLREEFLYPKLQEKGGSLGATLPSLEEIRGLVLEYKESPNEERLGDLSAAVETWMQAEERGVFPVLDEALGNEAPHLGAQIERRIQELRAAPYYRDAQPAEVQNPNGGEQMRRQSMG